MRGKGFVNDTLISMKGQLDTSAFPMEAHASLDDPPPIPKNLKARPEEKIIPAMDALPSKTTSGVQGFSRNDELHKLRSDLARKLAHCLGDLEREENEAQRLSKSRNDAILCLGRLANSLNSGELTSIRDLEQVRMEYFQIEGKFSNSASLGANKSATKGVLGEMAEFTKSDIIHFAILWSLPIVLAVTFCAGVIALAIIWSLKV